VKAVAVKSRINLQETKAELGTLVFLACAFHFPKVIKDQADKHGYSA
jgi:hypothetical protein